MTGPRGKRGFEMSAQGAQLADSAFLANVDRRDRSFWRFLATLAAGGVGGLAVGLVVGIITLIAFALAAGLAGDGASGFAAKISALLSADGSTLTSALMLLTLAAFTNG